MPRLNATLTGLLPALILWADPDLVSAAEKTKSPPRPSPAPTVFFEQTIQPILAEHCFQCHSHAAQKIKGGLVLDSRAGALKGGNSGPALVPGKPEASLLIKAIRHEDPDLHMPPQGRPLPPAQIEALAQWVKQGAPWPGSTPAAGSAPPRGTATRVDRPWWAYQPLREPKVPAPADGGWSRTPLDKFIFARLKAEGLKPSPPAGREVLIRRVYFDLTGLPPAPEEVDEFVADPAPDAYEQLVERLLRSPRYGEHWARHWLDLARYAESDGYKADDYRPQVWRYRDYVIQSFNDDKPYPRFVQEQLAGDELWPDRPEAIIATAFLRHWIYEYNIRDVKGQWATILNEITDVTGDLFLGTGVQCARCHDHKFDPILQKDYYRLQAFFTPLLPREDWVAATPEQKAAHAAQLSRWQAAAGSVLRQIETLESSYRQRAAEEAIGKFPDDVQAALRKAAAERTPYEQQIAALAQRQLTYEFERLDGRIKGADKEALEGLRKKLKEFDALKPAPLPTVLAVTDVGPQAPPTVIPKGKNPAPVEPGFLSVLDEKPARILPVATAPQSTGRRTELARWLTQPDHPLSTRVIANRIWQYHFGRGLVGSSSDFGHLGDRPTHPELLDWLATKFVQGGWSFKALHRVILNSATYRQAAVVSVPESARLKDPENRLLWHMPTRRLEAEQIRDALLSATGELDVRMGGPAVDYSQPRRTIYSRVTRNLHDPLLEVFDAPDNFFSTAQRNVTTTPTQALLLINSQPMLQRARTLALRLIREQPGQEADRITRAYRLTFGRKPDAAELQAARAFLDAQARRIPEEKPAAAPFLAEKLPLREGKAAVLQPKSSQELLEVSPSPSLPRADFTLEAFVLLRSTYDDASVRTIAAHWDGQSGHPGWSLGVTGKQSQHRPQSLVLQLSRSAESGGEAYEPVFSSLRLELNKSYYVAVSVQLAATNEAGIAFYLQDLANDCEPMRVVNARHRITSPSRAPGPFTIGGRSGSREHLWDGLIDDVRLSQVALSPDQLLVHGEGVTAHTVGYWRFEANPQVYHDASSYGNHIQPRALARAQALDPQTQALVDFCHVLLNANEFLYVD